MIENSDVIECVTPRTKSDFLKCLVLSEEHYKPQIHSLYYHVPQTQA